MSTSMFRKACASLVVLATPFAFAVNTGVAVLYGTGSVFLNGSQLSNSNAVTVGDVIQTKENGSASITAPGSSIAVQSNSIVRYHEDGVSLDRGALSVATGTGTAVYARDFKITPVSQTWTEFYVTRSSGSIGVIARKNAVTINCGSGSTTVKEGQQISRADADNCGLAARETGAPTAAKAPILLSPTAKWIALGTGGVLTFWALDHSDDPISPKDPSGP